MPIAGSVTTLVLHRGSAVGYNQDVDNDTGSGRSHHDSPASTTGSPRPLRMARFVPQRTRVTLSSCLCSCVLAAVLSGCREAEISSYRVPKPDQVYADNHEEGPDGMLAAMIPRDSTAQAWFFKVAGLKGPVSGQQQAFREFLASVRFGKETGEPEWTLPEGWQQPGGTSSTGMRYATLVLGKDPDALELSVTRLPLPKDNFDAYLLQNVNRWRKQLRLNELPASQLSSETRSMAVGDERAIVVNRLVGHLGSSGPMMGPFAGGGSTRPPGPAPGPAQAGDTPRLSYTNPETWRPGDLEVTRSGITIRRQAAFEFGSGDETGEVTVTAMPTSPRFLLLNVNRWRRQVALEAVDSDNLDDLFEPIALGSINGRYLELVGHRVTILGTIVVSSGKTWFFKLSAPNRLADRSRTEFKSFVSSSRFDASGGSDGG